MYYRLTANKIDEMHLLAFIKYKFLTIVKNKLFKIKLSFLDTFMLN